MRWVIMILTPLSLLALLVAPAISSPLPITTESSPLPTTIELAPPTLQYGLFGKVEIWNPFSDVMNEFIISSIPTCIPANRTEYSFTYGTMKAYVQFGLTINEKCDVTLFCNTVNNFTTQIETRSIDLSDSNAIASYGLDQAIIKEHGIVYQIARYPLPNQPDVLGPLKLIIKHQNITASNNSQLTYPTQQSWPINLVVTKVDAKLLAKIFIFDNFTANYEPIDVMKITAWPLINKHVKFPVYINLTTTLKPELSDKGLKAHEITGRWKEGSYYFNLKRNVNPKAPKLSGETANETKKESTQPEEPTSGTLREEEIYKPIRDGMPQPASAFSTNTTESSTTSESTGTPEATNTIETINTPEATNSTAAVTSEVAHNYTEIGTTPSTTPSVDTTSEKTPLAEKNEADHSADLFVEPTPNEKVSATNENETTQTLSLSDEERALLGHVY